MPVLVLVFETCSCFKSHRAQPFDRYSVIIFEYCTDRSLERSTSSITPNTPAPISPFGTPCTLASSSGIPSPSSSATPNLSSHSKLSRTSSHRPWAWDPVSWFQYRTCDSDIMNIGAEPRYRPEKEEKKIRNKTDSQTGSQTVSQTLSQRIGKWRIRIRSTDSEPTDRPINTSTSTIGIDDHRCRSRKELLFHELHSLTDTREYIMTSEKTSYRRSSLIIRARWFVDSKSRDLQRSGPAWARAPGIIKRCYLKWGGEIWMMGPGGDWTV